MCWVGLFQHRCHLPGGAPFQPQLQIKPIQQRAGELLPVALALADAAATAMVAVAMPAAGAGIGGGHKVIRAGNTVLCWARLICTVPSYRVCRN